MTSTLAGNLTRFGSVANIIVVQGAQKSSPLKFSDFLRVGIPVKIMTTSIGVLMLWAFFKARLVQLKLTMAFNNNSN